ncbi:NAD(P)H-dependent flavin oxidoreductase [Lachnotalea glycerini]|uniref:NAD(P)H-dependent flavin oxidoreductase n=1 Tax=Lachnotalea glycerini TaxID=1763509 RepID=UPI000D753A1C
MLEIKPLQIGELVAKVPVIQGGMGVGISLSNLAGNVAAEGGIGIISTAQIGFRSKEFNKNPMAENLKAIAEEIKKAREIAKGGIIGVNIMVATKDYEEYVKAAVKAGVDLIISGAGLPTILPKLIESSKTKIAPIVSSLKAADIICKLWDRRYKKSPDLVVIEGAKAGGHLGFSLEEIESFNQDEYDMEIEKIIKLVDEYGKKYEKQIPVVVAGGVYTREDLEHYINLGASGVQIASRFVGTYECDADIKYKEAYIKAAKEDVVIVKSPVGMPGRAIHNAFLERLKQGPIKVEGCKNCLSHCDPATIPYCITQALINAAKGDIDNGLIFCGDNVYRVDKMVHVKDIMDEFK